MSFEFRGIEDTARRIEDLAARMDTALIQVVDEITAHTVERARANAPILSGDLRANLYSTRAQKVGTKIVSTVNQPDDYALYQHEGLLPYGSGAYPKLGPISAQQPSTPEGGVGGKYISRVQNHWAEDYKRRVKERIDTIK